MQCIMLDAGGRIKQTSIESMAKTFHSLTYSYPTYGLQEYNGPRICVLFTNVSKYNFQEDDIGPEGAESESLY